MYNIWEPISSNSFDLLVSSIHNESYLYISSKANFNNIYKDDITFYFHSNRALNFSDENSQINDGNDVKIIESNSNCSFDGFTNVGGIIEDQKYSGANDSEGKCYITDTSIMFELKMPFYSRDDLGHDGVNLEFIIEEMKILNEIGLSTIEAIRDETIYPAKWLGIDKYYGTIEQNKKANILILDKNPLEAIENIKSTQLVIQNGILYQDIEDMRNEI